MGSKTGTAAPRRWRSREARNHAIQLPLKACAAGSLILQCGRLQAAHASSVWGAVSSGDIHDRPKWPSASRGYNTAKDVHNLEQTEWRKQHYLQAVLSSCDAHDDIVRLMKTRAPLVTYTMVDEDTLLMDLEMDGKQMSHAFRLGEELVMKKHDGGKVRMTYTVEGDNVIKQVIKMPDGKTAYFRREFNDNEIKMIVTLDGTDLRGIIYYQVVQ